MTTHQTIEQALADALPVELRPYAADLAVLFAGLADPAEVVRRLAARPVLGAALAALVGQTLAVAGRPLHIVGNVGTLQQITLSGGYVDQIIGTLIGLTQLAPPAHLPAPDLARTRNGRIALYHQDGHHSSCHPPVSF